MTRCATDIQMFQIGPKTGAGVSWADAPEMQGPRFDRAPSLVAIAADGSYLPGEPILTEEIEARIVALSPGCVCAAACSARSPASKLAIRQSAHVR
jgi:hypothetical protein